MRVDTSTFGPLAPYLIELAYVFQERDLPLTLIGGFGLVLRRQWHAEHQTRTLINEVPPARATEDFDVLLALELLADDARRLAVREALQEAGYEIKLEFLHFVKSIPGEKQVKVDFLAPPVTSNQPKLKEKGIRVGPRQSTDSDKLHGFRTPEAALHLGNPLDLNLDGPDTSGTEKHVGLILPHPFMLLVMKIHAFRDEYEGRKSNGVRRSALAQKHLRDAYTLVSLLTPSDVKTLDQLAKQSKTDAVYKETANIVRDLFKGTQSPGALMLQGNLTVDPDDLETFLSLLEDTFNEQQSLETTVIHLAQRSINSDD